MRALLAAVAAFNCFLQGNYVGPEIAPADIPAAPVLLAGSSDLFLVLVLVLLVLAIFFFFSYCLGR